MAGRAYPLLAALAAATIGFSAAAARAAAPSIIWARLGGSAADADKALDACTSESRAIQVGRKANSAAEKYYLSQPGSAVIANFTLAAVDALETPKARSAYVESCMAGRGFVGLNLTSDERDDLASQKTADARLGWMDRLYHRPDFQGRVSAAISEREHPQVRSLLPQAITEPMTVGALRLDLSKLTVSDAVISVGQPALSGRAEHRRTARVTSDVDIGGSFHFHLTSGTILHEVVSNGQTYWCGLIGARAVFQKVMYNHCVWGGANAMRMWWGEGDPYLVDRPEAGNDLYLSPSVVYALEPSATDLLGPIDFRLVVKRIGPGGLTLEAVADHNGKTQVAWTSDVLFDDAGEAILPFWSHHLKFTRTKGGVLARLTPDGDGRGWDDANSGAVK